MRNAWQKIKLEFLKNSWISRWITIPKEKILLHDYVQITKPNLLCRIPSAIKKRFRKFERIILPNEMFPSPGWGRCCRPLTGIDMRICLARWCYFLVQQFRNIGWASSTLSWWPWGYSCSEKEWCLIKLFLHCEEAGLNNSSVSTDNMIARESTVLWRCANLISWAYTVTALVIGSGVSGGTLCSRELMGNLSADCETVEPPTCHFLVSSLSTSPHKLSSGTRLHDEIGAEGPRTSGTSARNERLVTNSPSLLLWCVFLAQSRSKV